MQNSDHENRWPAAPGSPSCGMRYPFNSPGCILSLTHASNPPRVNLDGQKITHRRGDGRSVGPAICGLLVRTDPRPAEYAVLRFHALRSVQSESRLLQGDGFLAVSQRAACGA